MPSALLTRSTVITRISDLLARAEHPGVRIAHPEQLTGRDDQVLYVAQRDMQRRRVAGEFGTWRSDLVGYVGGILPGGEPHRSIGHWNRLRQVEIFQVYSGHVVMVVATETGWCSVADYGPGDVCVIPPGAFHLTYCPDGAASVFNIYAEPDFFDETTRDKYEGAPPPDFDPDLRTARVPLPPGLMLPTDLADVLANGTDAALADLAACIEAASATGWPAL